METQTTRGIRISVQSHYETAYSKPTVNQYVFSYRIRIENRSPNTVQLLRRHWHITDSIGFTREVEGEGVIGKTPVIAPGEVHAYDSWCPLSSPLGFMKGTYLMLLVEEQEYFDAVVPRFPLESTVALN